MLHRSVCCMQEGHVRYSAETKLGRRERWIMRLPHWVSNAVLFKIVHGVLLHHAWRYVYTSHRFGLLSWARKKCFQPLLFITDKEAAWLFVTFFCVQTITSIVAIVWLCFSWSTQTFGISVQKNKPLSGKCALASYKGCVPQSLTTPDFRFY